VFPLGPFNSIPSAIPASFCKMVAEQSFLPIAELSAYQTKWTIKARVTNKAQLRTFSKGAGQGKVFSVDLLDAMGGEIRASFFNQAADKYFDVLEKGKCFTFCRGNIKIANRQYNSMNHRYELNFDKDAVVEVAQDDANIQNIKFTFVNLRAVGARSLPTTVDICGVITNYLPSQSVNTKEGVELLKRELTIADDTATSLKVTIWGDRAKQDDSVFDGNPVVALKSVAVKEWKETRSGSLSSGGELMIKPSMAEATRLQQWWLQGGSSQELKQLSVLPAGSEATNRSGKATTLSGLRDASEQLGSQPEIYNLVARLALVQMQKQGAPQPLHYMACQEPKEGYKNLTCNKRVDEQGFCASCNRAGKVAPRLNVRCRFVDFEDQAWLTSFHEGASKILGMSGQEVRDLEQAAAEKGEAGREELEAAIKSRYFDKPMNITVRAKMDNYMGEPRTNVTITDARPVSKSEHGRHMLKEIGELLSKSALAGA